MNTFQVLRIAALLAVIFVAGLLTGRLTAPGHKTRVMQYTTLTTNGRPVAEVVLEGFKEQAHLTPEQIIEMRKIVQEMDLELSAFPPLTEERLQVFHRFLPRIKAILRPEQQEVAKRYAEDIDRRFESPRRRRIGNR